jgi:hypothetical protein
MKTLLRSAGVAMVLACAAAVVTAPAANAQDGCTYSVRNPKRSGNYVWAEAPWHCTNAPGIYSKVYVRLLRDGAVVKESEFGNYGTYKVTFSTGAPCAKGTHRYRTVSLGWDGLPTSYPGKGSAWVNITC